jgi:hypothetical protein
LIITQTARRAPPGNASFDHCWIGEWAMRSVGSMVVPPEVHWRREAIPLPGKRRDREILAPAIPCALSVRTDFAVKAEKSPH